MAQYGKNYYGASYYGINGVFAGQFTSDPTDLNAPLSNVAPSDGKLYVDLICAHPKITYTYPDDMFIRTGMWNDGASSISSSDPTFRFSADLVASTIELNYAQRVDGANIDVEVKTYVAGSLVETNTYTVDTIGAGPYVIHPSQFGEQVITITKNASSGASEVFEFRDIKAVTTDVKLEMRYKNSDDTLGTWGSVQLTPTESDITYNGTPNAYKYSAQTPDWTGKVGYQAKLMMASSDNSNTPEVISMDIHTASTGGFSTNGYWKTTIDLVNVGSLDSITYDIDQPTGTKVEIRSRSSDIDGSWSPWTVPYSTSAHRAALNYKTSPSLTSGYIITPLISPENLTTWQHIQLLHYLNYIDTFTGATTPGANIKVEVVNANYNPLSPRVADVLKAFTITNAAQVAKVISSITVPIRLKVNFTRTTAVASPAIDSISTLSNAYYKEYKAFGSGLNDLKGYGSAVYGENTGIDDVYTDGLARNTLATISSLGFTIPVGAENPEYVIEPSRTFAETYTVEEVDISWKSNETKSVHLEGALTDDNIVVKVKEAKDIHRIRKHYRYGSGIVLSLEPEYTIVNLTNTFNPGLTPGRQYAYYVKNGFLLEDPNARLDIRWKSENAVSKSQRRSVTYTLNDQIYISISTGNINGLVEWVSEEKNVDGIVNANDIYNRYSVTITDLPEIERGVIIDPDPNIIPYKVEVIEGSVISRGQRKPESILSGSVRYLYASDQTPSLVETIEEKAEVVRGSGSKDYLPKAMVKGISGVYSDASQYSTYYGNGVDYDYAIPSGSVYSNEIDWSKGLLGGAAKAPDEGATYYVTYTYDKVVSLRVEFTCDYSEYEPIPQIYRSPVKEFSGQCSPMFDYTSQQMSFSDFVIPTDVDKSTLRFVVYDDNARVRTYLDSNCVVGTLDNRDPRESWTPYVRGGHYYIGKDSYYMFTSESSHSLGSGTIPIAENVSYVNGVNGIGVRIEEATSNLAINPSFERGAEMTGIFYDNFDREGY